jgi:hypothetical protein
VDDIRLPARIVEGDFRGWLRDSMNAKHLSPRMVGRKSGLDPTAVARLLYGGRQPTLMTLMALIDLFDDLESPPAADWADDPIAPTEVVDAH